MAETSLPAFWTSKPADQAEYVTLEFSNPVAGVERFVTLQTFDKDFQLEASAPRNAGEIVTFKAVQFSAPDPEQGENGMSLEINIGAIGFEAKKYIKQAFSAWPPTIDVVWRKHLSGVNEPLQVYYMQAKQHALESVNLSLLAEQVNQMARNVSRSYDDSFQGLQGQI